MYGTLQYRGAECLCENGLERKRRAESEAYAKHRLQPKLKLELKLWYLFWNVLQAPSSDRERTSLRAALARGVLYTYKKRKRLSKYRIALMIRIENLNG